LPSLQLSNELDMADLTHDMEIVERQRNDPLNHGKVTPKMYIEFLKTQQEVQNRANTLRLPLLVMHGGADKMSAVSVSEEFHSGAGSNEKRLIVYEGFYHEIFNELERERVFSDLIGWMNSILERP
jgi:alpha-beta hydrolase superfamily lysophospholipase